MALVDLWKSDRTQIEEKRIEQLIAFAGEGRLRDGNTTSKELRSLLSIVPSDLLGEWITECLDSRFQDFGFVLQDIVNEIGGRLGFDVTPGVYRSHAGEGFDGLWRDPSGAAILVESKSTTTYRINLARIASYRKQVCAESSVPLEDISILLVVGTEDTEDLEAQVRGSRYAWSVRLLGTSSLFRLLKLKESLDDPNVERQIQEILIPQEFTRLDRIVDLVFATAEEVQSEEEVASEESEIDDSADVARRPASFHAKIIPRLEAHFGHPLVKRTRVTWSSPDGQVVVSCQVSREFSERRDMSYWFGFKRRTKETFDALPDAYCAFGLGSPDLVLLFPYNEFAEHLDGFFTSPDKQGRIRHWHVRFLQTGQVIELLAERDQNRIDVTRYLLE